MENMSVCKLMSESELIDILFHTCDVTKVGRVPVASLVDYLEKMTDTQAQHREAVAHLYQCLDPTGVNAEVDIDTYRAGMLNWIQQIRNGFSREDAPHTEQDVDEKRGKCDIQVPVYSPYFRGYNTILVESLPFEGPHQYNSDSVDWAGQLEDLQHANRRLCQDNSKLQTQMEAQEDTLMTLTHDKELLVDKIRRLQEIADVQSEIIAENEELKAALSRYQEQKREQESRVHQLEKENQNLLSQLRENEAELHKLTSEGEAVKSHVKELQHTIYEQKVSLENGYESQRRQETELLEKDQALSELKMNVAELSRLNEDLKASNEELQYQVSQIQEHLARHNQQQMESSVHMLMSTGSSDSDDENSEVDDTFSSCPIVADEVTPRESTSIDREIREMLGFPLVSPFSVGTNEQSQCQWTCMTDSGTGIEVDVEGLMEKLEGNFQSFITSLTGNKNWVTEPGATEDSLQSPIMDKHSDRGEDGTDGCDGCPLTRIPPNWNEGFKQFLLMVKNLKEENQRLHRIHDSAVTDMMDRAEDSSSATLPEDCRIVVLRNMLMEERAQKIILQKQLETLKRVVAIVDQRDSVDFETVKETLFRQQEKIEELERSNLDLAEKYHRADLKVTDLQEEALQAALTLDQEKHRCSKLEDAVSTTALARQLDLREIWRLVQKDVETEYLDNQDDSGISASTEELKEKIVEEIKTLHNQLHQKEDSQGIVDRSKMSLPLQRTAGQGRGSSHCCGYKCSSPSSPLVDALTIDFFNGNYYPAPKKSRSAMAVDPYLNYLRLSCEDVDCMECRAVRLGLDFHGVASCPSLQLRLGHEAPGFGLGGVHSVVTALDYNFNSHAGCPMTAGPHNANSSTASGTDVGSHYNNQRLDNSSNNSSQIRSAAASAPAASAKHRRLDFVKSSSRWTSGTMDSCTSGSMDSTSNSECSFVSAKTYPSTIIPPQRFMENSQSLPFPLPYQSSPAGYRRMSFLAAVDKSKQQGGEWNRRPSYRAAVDPSYLGVESVHPASENTGPNKSDADTHGRSENKTVTFQLGSKEDEYSFSTSLSSSSDSDSAFGWGPGTAQHPRGDNSRARKLSILLEEDGEDSGRSPEHRSPPTSSDHAHWEDSFGSVEREGSKPGTGVPQSAGHETQSYGSGSLPLDNNDTETMKPAFLMSTEDSQGGMASQPACSAEKLPAHFRRNAAVRPAVSTTSASVPVSTAPATNSTSGQPMVLVPGSPPQTPRSAHDGDRTSPPAAAPPSRLAKLRQTNLARKREQMKTMKMPELSESAEADSETTTTTNSSFSSAKSSSLSSRRGGTVSSRLASSPPEISVTSDEEDSACKASGDELLRPPSPTDDPVTPSIPDSFLKQLGLSTEGKGLNGGEGSQTSFSLTTDCSDSVSVVRRRRHTVASRPPLVSEVMDEVRNISDQIADEFRDTSIDQLPDKQLESRFNSLSLAFKTDRQTLEKRLGIQERSRDIAEQNIDKELQGLRDAVETLNQLCGDEKVQDVVAKIHHHLDILEHSVARVSSRAEVFGAVQQEKRMSLAMEVMITFTENIRRLREKEQADVEEARKVLSERSQSSSSLGLDFGGLGDRRSASVCAALNNPRTLTQRSRTSTPSPTPQSLSIDKGDLSSIPDTRRRSEIALPKFFMGGSGSPSLHVSSSMDAGYLSDSPPSFGSSSRQALTDTEEPRQRFQSATANITVRNVVANTFRRASLERQKNLSVQSSSSSSGLSSSRNNSVDKSPDTTDTAKKQSSQEEEAYRHGYEEGLKASLGRELNELRDQQTSISGGVEQVMDRIETLQQEDSQDSELDETLSKVKDILVQTRLWVSNPNWQSASHTLRRIAAGIIFLIAMIVVILTFAPLVPGNITMRNHGKPAQ